MYVKYVSNQHGGVAEGVPAAAKRRVPSVLGPNAIAHVSVGGVSIMPFVSVVFTSQTRMVLSSALEAAYCPVLSTAKDTTPNV